MSVIVIRWRKPDNLLIKTTVDSLNASIGHYKSGFLLSESITDLFYYVYISVFE